MNAYSPTWYELFLETITPEQTDREAECVARCLPQPAFTSVLDLCCGQGRHARALAARGYRVTGVDANAAAIAAARRQPSQGITYHQHDMRRLDELPSTFDAAICLWQSFGYFDSAINAEVLRQLARKLPPGGRLVLDIYNRGFFERSQGTRHFERDGRSIVESKRIEGDRLMVSLDYGPDLPLDVYEWQLFSPGTIVELARQTGFELLLACASFDQATPPSADLARMQLVLERD